MDPMDPIGVRGHNIQIPIRHQETNLADSQHLGATKRSGRFPGQHRLSSFSGAIALQHL